MWGKGFDVIGEVIDCAEEFGIVLRGGAWYSYEETKIGQGMDNARTMLEDNPELYEEIRKKVINMLKKDVKEDIIQKEEAIA